MRAASWLIFLFALLLPAEGSGITLGEPIDLSSGLRRCDFRDVGAAALPGTGYLAVWTSDRGIYGRIVPFSGGPPGPARLLAPAEEPHSIAPLAGPVPTEDGRWLLAWTEGDPQISPDGRSLRWLFLDATGEPTGAPVTADLPVDVAYWFSLLPLAGGDLLAVWPRLFPGPGEGYSFDVVRLAPGGERRGDVEMLEGVRSPSPVASLFASGADGAVLVWADEDVPHPILAVTLDGEGRIAGSIRTLASQDGLHTARLSGHPDAGDGGVVLWSRFDGVFAVGIDAVGDPEGPAERVDGIDPDVPFQAIDFHAAARGPSGIDLAVAGFRSDLSSWPGLFFRPLDGAGRPIAPPVTAVSPARMEALERTFSDAALAAGPDGRSLLVWSERQQVPVTPPPPCLNGVQVSALRIAAAGDPDAPPPPPGLPGLVSPELPGFRFWARMTPPGTAPVPATPVKPCPPETLCLAGALPGRAEVLVRVIGPRPNGSHWPLMARFTPSRVEVWIEQVASGALRYYDLPVVPPGDDSLPGLLDRLGFPPFE